MASSQRAVSQTERGRKWRWESETQCGYRGQPGRSETRVTGQPLGRGGVFELFIFIIIASRVFIIIITRDHRCDGGDTWAGCVLVCDRQECCYLHIWASPVFSPRSKFVLTWPNVIMLLLRVWRLGPGLAIVVGLLIGHQALDNTQPGGAGDGRVNFDSVQCQLRQWAQNTNTEIITHCTPRPGLTWPNIFTKSWPRLICRLSWFMVTMTWVWSQLILAWLAPPSGKKIVTRSQSLPRYNRGLQSMD